jgi:type 1 fimbriae regulatory protein FimB
VLFLMFRYGLRVSEACRLRLSQVDTDSRVLHVARLKKGLSTTHPLHGDDLRAIKAWLAERAKMKPEIDTFFISERRGPLSCKTVWVASRTYGGLVGLPVDAHPLMLRHACGFALADQGTDTQFIQDHLGRRNIQHPVRYRATNPAQFERLWR